MIVALDQDMPCPVPRNRPRYADDIHAPLCGLKARAILAWGNAPGYVSPTDRGLKARAKSPTRRPTHDPLLETAEDE